MVTPLPDKTKQTFRWVNDLEHTDDEGRLHIVHALSGEESGPQGKQTFAWVRDFRLNSKNVCAVASQGGRVRCNIENQGFNIQQNRGLNLEHAYSTDPDVMKSCYYLLQIAHLFLQMFEMGRLLRRLAQDYNTTPVGTLRQPQEHRQGAPGMFSMFSTGRASLPNRPGPDPLVRPWVEPPLEAIQAFRPPEHLRPTALSKAAVPGPQRRPAN